MIKKALIIVITCLFGISCFAGNDIPKVIPALQSWKKQNGKFIPKQTGTIVVSKKDSGMLMQTALILKDDLKEMMGYEYSVTTGLKAGKGDISLSIGKEKNRLGCEGYECSIGDKIEIEANTAKGVFWGTRTLLQMIYNQPDGLQKGKAIDFPKYSNRGFMIDVARKFFSMDFLKNYVKILSFYKMNELQIHLNDNGFVEFSGNDWNKTYSAFRLESDRYPGLTAKDGSYTKEEFRELQKMAAEYGITIIPEIDVPAHSLAFTHYNPRLAADNKEYGADHLDLYKKEVYDFVDSLFDEYLSGENPVFIGPEVHIGTDEYNLKEAEQFRHFTNHYVKLIKKYGKTPRVWGSLKMMKGETEVNLEDCVISAWNANWMDVKTSLATGAKVVNLCDWFLYLVPAVNYYHDFLEYEWLYNNWRPEMMRKDETIEEGNPNFLGAMLAVWNDRVGNGVSQQDVHFRCFPAIQLVSDKLWKGENSKNVSYKEFEKLCQTTPEAPGVNLMAKVEKGGNLIENNKILSIDGKTKVTTKINEIGYPYAVEFDIRTDSVPAIDGILFKGPHSEFVTNWQNTGKFAFRRDGYEFVFHDYRLPASEWTKIRIEGDVKGTTLFVNGKKIERLEGRTREVYNFMHNRKDKFWYVETLIFPLETIGDEYMGFKGDIKNISYRHTENK